MKIIKITKSATGAVLFGTLWAGVAWGQVEPFSPRQLTPPIQAEIDNGYVSIVAPDEGSKSPIDTVASEVDAGAVSSALCGCSPNGCCHDTGENQQPGCFRPRN